MGKVIVKCGRGCVKRIPAKLTKCGFRGMGGIICGWWSQTGVINGRTRYRPPWRCRGGISTQIIRIILFIANQHKWILKTKMFYGVRNKAILWVGLEVIMPGNLEKTSPNNIPTFSLSSSQTALFAYKCKHRYTNSSFFLVDTIDTKRNSHPLEYKIWMKCQYFEKW